MFAKRCFVFFCGLALALVMLEAGLRGFGLLRGRSAARREARALERAGAYRILCLGESTTWHQYPQELERVLRQALPGMDINVFDGALAGIDSNFILEKLEADLDRYKPDLVTVMMGCNDGEEVLDYGDIGSQTTLDWMYRLRVFGLFRLLWWNLEEKLAARRGAEDGPRENEDTVDGEDGGDGDAFEADDTGEEAEAGPVADEHYIPRAPEGFAPEPAPEPEFEYAGREDAAGHQAGPGSGALEDRIRFYESRAVAEPENSDNFFHLGLLMVDRGDIGRAYIFLRKAQKLNPTDAQIYGSLASTCPAYEMEYWVDRALEIEPEHGIEPTGTIRALMLLKRFDEALKYLEKVVATRPEEKICFIRLGIIYMMKNDYGRAEESLRRGLEHHPGDRALLRTLALVRHGQGRTMEAGDRPARPAEKGALFENYNRLADILEERGIRLVAVQYPVQSIAPLKRILARHEGVVYVDNERSFRDGVMKDGFFAYFVDSFGGNFGHCTKKGNDLAARNIARVILREVFGVQGGLPR